MTSLLSKILCFVGIHKWEYPGGHCVDCHLCDEFFGKHTDRFLRFTPAGPEQHCNGDFWKFEN